MSNYDAVAQTVIRQSPAPYAGVILDVIEYPDYPGWGFLTVYASNLAEYSDNQIHSIRDWLQDVLDNLNNHPLIATKFTWNVSQKEPQ